MWQNRWVDNTIMVFAILGAFFGSLGWGAIIGVLFWLLTRVGDVWTCAAVGMILAAVVVSWIASPRR
jgi:hypothetical protein